MKDRRLLACAELCVGKRAADVGTDHAYLPIYLVENGICESALACDINEGPLASALDNIKKAGLSDKIETYLSNGLDSVPSVGITDVIIAGMGGELIADIISRAEWIKSRRVNLVLQPMTKWDHLRKYLYDGGYTIINEIPCAEGKFVYSVLQAQYTGDAPDFPCDLAYQYGGRVDGTTKEGAMYLLRQASRLENAGKGLLRDPQQADKAKEFLDAAGALREKAIDGGEMIEQ